MSKNFPSFTFFFLTLNFSNEKSYFFIIRIIYFDCFWWFKVFMFVIYELERDAILCKLVDFDIFNFCVSLCFISCFCWSSHGATADLFIKLRVGKIVWSDIFQNDKLMHSGYIDLYMIIIRVNQRVPVNRCNILFHKNTYSFNDKAIVKNESSANQYQLFLVNIKTKQTNLTVTIK